jgi:hypothetical protein
VQTEAWFTALQDLDERINRKKACNLDDMYRGVLVLLPHERGALAAILAATTKKVLPLSQLNIR